MGFTVRMTHCTHQLIGDTGHSSSTLCVRSTGSSTDSYRVTLLSEALCKDVGNANASSLPSLNVKSNLKR